MRRVLLAGASWMLLLLVCVAGMQETGAQQQHLQEQQKPQKPLSTQHLHLNKATVTVVPDAEGTRPHTTRVKVQVQQDAVNPIMAVTTARSNKGLTQNVVDALRFLKNYALLHTRLADINKQSGDDSRPFPKPSLAHKAASLLQPSYADLADYTARAEAAGDHKLWTHCSAPNVLLLPTGGEAFGAVADVLNVEETPAVGGGADGQPAAITLTMDVIHEPRTINELALHPKQTMDDDAHFHWYTPQGIDVDASKMLSLLSSSPGGVLQGLSVFMKGGAHAACDGKKLHEPCVPVSLDHTGPCVSYKCTDDDKDNILSCSPVFFPLGTVCEAAKGHCQPARVCLGDTGTCVKTVAPNGQKCPFTDADHHPTLFPFATKDALSSNTAALLHDEPHECWGHCHGGKCTIDKSYGGCCQLSDRDYRDYSDEQYTATANKRGGDYDKERVICWERQVY